MSTFLKRAAVNRINARMRNAKEEMTQPLTTSLSLDDLEQSTLAPADRFHLRQWAQGRESGRACMLAMLDASHAAEQERSDAPPELHLGPAPDPAASAPGSSSAAAAAASANTPQSIELTLLSASVNLPPDFLSRSTFLYQHVFSKPPVVVLREALALLADTAQESSAATLDCHQANLAIKQIRMDNIARVAEELACAEAAATGAEGSSSSGSSSSVMDKENRSEKRSNNGLGDEQDSSSSADDKAARHKRQSQLSQARLRRAREEETRLQIMVELLRIHIATRSAAADGEGGDEAWAGAGAGAGEGAGVGAGAEEGAAELPASVLASDIHRTILTPLEAVEEAAAEMPADALEERNLLLKPYINRLAAMRAALQVQLSDLEKNQAFFSLGLSQGCECSDAQIKKVALLPNPYFPPKTLQALLTVYMSSLSLTL